MNDDTNEMRCMHAWNRMDEKERTLVLLIVYWVALRKYTSKRNSVTSTDLRTAVLLSNDARLKSSLHNGSLSSAGFFSIKMRTPCEI
jgi:hypothetical protein